MKSIKSISQVFSVFLHVSAQNVLDWPEQSLEGFSVDRYDSAVCLSLNTCLPYCVLYQSYLSEIISLFILEDFFSILSVFAFLSNKSAISNNIKSVTILALLNDVFPLRELLPLQRITDLLFLIWVNISKNFNFRKDRKVRFSFFDCCLLNDICKCNSVKSVHFSFSFAFYSCSSGSVVH